ncbi:hypothetical protein [Streptomyces sp. NPDC052036]|uniref:hypothetical protein n=1 Tax=Streptomyces sp. NPDC052036 TaxID=3155171 RepID=UPI001679A7C3
MDLHQQGAGSSGWHQTSAIPFHELLSSLQLRRQAQPRMRILKEPHDRRFCQPAIVVYVAHRITKTASA